MSLKGWVIYVTGGGTGMLVAYLSMWQQRLFQCVINRYYYTLKEQ